MQQEITFGKLNVFLEPMARFLLRTFSTICEWKISPRKNLNLKLRIVQAVIFYWLMRSNVSSTLKFWYRTSVMEKHVSLFIWFIVEIPPYLHVLKSVSTSPLEWRVLTIFLRIRFQRYPEDSILNQSDTRKNIKMPLS